MQLHVLNDGVSNLRWEAKAGGDSFALHGSSTPLTVQLNADLPSGGHHGKIVITSNGGDRTIDVRANVRRRGQQPAPGPGPREMTVTPPPQPSFSWVGLWRVSMNMFGIATEYQLQLAPNGALTGIQHLMGIQGQLQGQWAFDGPNSVLAIRFAATALGMTSEPELLHIRVQQTPQGLVGTDLAGRNYHFQRLG